MIETPALLAQVLAGPHGTDMEIDPAGSPVGAVVRVLFNEAPFLGVEAGTGTFQSSSPDAYAREGDVTSITPEVTVVRIGGRDFTVNRVEPIEGGSWRRLVLNPVPVVDPS